jgi:hypothetical protein
MTAGGEGCVEGIFAKPPLTHPGRYPPVSLLSETTRLAFEAIAAFLDRSAVKGNPDATGPFHKPIGRIRRTVLNP